MTLPSAGCTWPIDPACSEEEWDALDDAVKDRAAALASNTLRRLTGYRVGGCPITVRPCKGSCSTGLPSYWSGVFYPGQQPFWPRMDERGLWVNSCGCGTDCGCGAICEVRLPGPVGHIDQVKIDGVAIDPSDYQVQGRSLVWVGGGDCPFPTVQDMSLPDTEAGTFSVTYLNAFPVDALGAYAAGVLAWEYAQACTNKKCRLPSGVTSITRQGVSMQIAAGAFPGGVTGIREVDSYIALWNPNGLRQEPQVYSPDLHSPRVVR